MTKVKAFLKKWIVNNIGYKILAIVFAFVLWLVILNTTDQDMTRTISNIPVTIENESVILDGTHVYTVEMGETATVVVSGKRSVINTLTPSDFSATVNFAELSLTNAVPIHIELTGEKARYANSVTINQKTMSMVINLEDVVEQTFDVQVSLRGEPKEGLIIEDADTLVFANGYHVESTVEEMLKEAGCFYHLIGDGNKVGNIKDAIQQGWEEGKRV